MIFTAIFLYFTLNHGTKNDGGLLVRRMPVQKQDGVIDHASHGYRVAALKLDQQQLSQQLFALQNRSHLPTNHKQEIV